MIAGILPIRKDISSSMFHFSDIGSQLSAWSFLLAAAAWLNIDLFISSKETVIISTFAYSAEFYASFTCIFLHLLLQVAYVPFDLLSPLDFSHLGRLSLLHFLIQTLLRILLSLLGLSCFFGFLSLCFLLKFCFGNLFKGVFQGLRISAFIISINDEVQLILLVWHFLLFFLFVSLFLGLVDLLEQLLFVQLFYHLSIFLVFLIGNDNCGSIVFVLFFLLLSPLLGQGYLSLQILSEPVPSHLLQLPSLLEIPQMIRPQLSRVLIFYPVPLFLPFPLILLYLFKIELVGLHYLILVEIFLARIIP